MKFLSIEKSGIENVVDEAQFEAIYKPAGWKIIGEEGATETTNSPTDEIVKKNTNKMKRQVPKKFDDKLIKGEEDGAL